MPPTFLIAHGDGDGDEPTQTADPRTHLRVGDHQINATHPEKGKIYMLPSHGPDIGGAQQRGPWFSQDGQYYDLTKKATVDGAVVWPSHFTVKRQGDKRIIEANNLPNQPTGQFPIDPDSNAARYDRNPNRIQTQQFHIELPAQPKPAPKAAPLYDGPIGFLSDGSVLYSPVDAGGRDAVAWEVQDHNQGHPEPNGTYHHHSIPASLWEKDDPTKPSTKVVGWAVDGYPITGPRGPGGKILTNDDLDEFHGTTSPILVDGKMQNVYHYVATLEFPYTLGAFKGTPAKVQGYTPTPPPKPGEGPPGGPPPFDGPPSNGLPPQAPPLPESPPPRPLT